MNEPDLEKIIENLKLKIEFFTIVHLFAHLFVFIVHGY